MDGTLMDGTPMHTDNPHARQPHGARATSWGFTHTSDENPHVREDTPCPTPSWMPGTLMDADEIMDQRTPHAKRDTPCKGSPCRVIPCPGGNPMPRRKRGR